MNQQLDHSLNIDDAAIVMVANALRAVVARS